MLKIKFESAENKIEQPEIIGAALLPSEEYKKYRSNISYIELPWWLLTPSKCWYEVNFVDECGDICDKGAGVWHKLGIRPTLILNNAYTINLRTGDKFKFGRNTFTIVSNNLAICNKLIGWGYFAEDWKHADANNYEKSDIKKVIDNWFNKTKQEEPDFLNKENIDFMLQTNDNVELRACLMNINHNLGFSGNRMDEIQKEIDDLFSDL